MKAPTKTVRCAIYTRVSTDSGLDQEFNSLDAQYDAASAYIRSQAHAHWALIRTRYDDGGMVPLGYELKEGKLLIAEKEAEQVRTIFRRYLELGSVNRLVVDLEARSFRTKIRKLSTGGVRGGTAFSQGPLFYMLRNCFYV